LKKIPYTDTKKSISLFFALMVTVGTITTTFFPASSLSMIDVYAIKDVEKIGLNVITLI
jgi:hypothetical protein